MPGKGGVTQLTEKYFVQLLFSFAASFSSLGPVLFLIYINDLPNCSSVLSFRIFADDTNVFASARDLRSLEQLINTELITLDFKSNETIKKKKKMY